MKKILILLLLFTFTIRFNAIVKQVVGAEPPLFSFELTEDWGLLNVDGEIKPHDFEIFAGTNNYVVQTMPYDTKHSITIAHIDVYEDCMMFTWRLYPGAHEEFTSATACNKEQNVATDFPIQNEGRVTTPIFDGLNNFDLYCYTGQTVGIVEFDLFDVVLIYKE